MSNCANIGTYGQLALNLANGLITGFSGSRRLEYIEESIGLRGEHSASNGIRGTRSRIGNRDRIVAERVTGSFTIEPTPAELEVLWPIMLGVGTKSSTTFSLMETLPRFAILCDKVVRRFLYDECVVSKATFSGQAKQPLRLTIEIEGQTETSTTNTFASYSPGNIDAGSPYILADGTLELGGQPVEFESFELVIDNMLDVDRYMNSVTRTCIPSLDRMISLSVGLPYNSDTNALHDLPIAGVAGELSFGLGSASTVFNFARLQVPPNTPSVSRAAELKLPLQFQAKASAASNGTITREMVVNHNPGS